MSIGFDVRGRALHDGELAAWLAEHSLGDRFGLAVVGPDPPQDSKAVALAIVAADGDGRHIDIAALAPDDEAALVSWLADPGPPKAVHEAKLAMRALAGCGWSLCGVTSDTVLAAYLLRPEQQSLALNDLLIQHMRCALPAETLGLQQFSSQAHPGGPDERAVRALILRACAVLDLADVLDEGLARTDSSSVLSRVELPVQRVLFGMETAGIAVDGAMLTRIRDQLDDEIHRGSSDELGLQKPKSDNDDDTTDTDASQTQSARLKVTVDGLLNSVASDGRIHPTFHQTGAVTGRLSSSKPNLHNIPMDLGAGRRIRDAFVAGDGYAALMTARYGQIEMRVMAHLSGDARLIEAFNTSANEAKQHIDQYFARGMRDYLRGVVHDARRVGYVSTLAGRRRYLPELGSRDHQVREAAERSALAMSIQGSAADIIKVAMINVNKAIKDSGLNSRTLMQVDDELIFEVANGERDALAAQVCEHMRGAYPLDVPLEVSLRYGPNWGGAEASAGAG